MGDDLPEADKYVFLDADTLFLKHGDWESDECFGAVSEEHLWPRQGLIERDLMRNFDSIEGRQAFYALYETYGKPHRCNSGCIVLPADIRKEVGRLWKKWCDKLDALTEKPSKQRCQMQFGFVMAELNLPILPSRFSAFVKKEDVRPDHVLIHAAGKPGPPAVQRYHDAVQRVLGGYLGHKKLTDKNLRWQVLARLILILVPDPTHPVGAEIGIGKGVNASHLLGTFPGLKLHCVDNWEGVWSPQYDIWCKVKEKYSERVVEHKCPSDKAEIDEPLDFVFIDANHETESVTRDIKYWYPKVKDGGVIAGHDIGNSDLVTGNAESVKNAVNAAFGGRHKIGPDFVWWAVKREGALRV